MSSPDEPTVSLPIAQANYVAAMVASGAYATASDVVQAGLRLLQEHDAAVEAWLQDEVVPAAAAMEADPGRGIPAAEVFAELRALHARRNDGAG